jgi:hypothetical protein
MNEFEMERLAVRYINTLRWLERRGNFEFVSLVEFPICVETTFECRVRINAVSTSESSLQTSSRPVVRIRSS